ncbi:MAG: PEP/pyruvate-binding domain-containing protein, partial [Anaerolineales bacterium]
MIEDLKKELGHIIKPGKLYAIRSSANIEDSSDRSFAGQFKSVMNAKSIEDVIQAIWSVWSSAKADNVLSYLEAHRIPEDQLLMAVLIQEMVPAVFSGVALSRNPVTAADEIIVEAISGSGDRLVQGGFTPIRWVNKWGYWVEKPADAPIPFSVIEQVVEETRQIAEKLGYQIDLEWVYNGEQLYWVQVREISALNQKNVYSNHISREFIPGMIKPLVYSVNIPLVNSVWIDWISEITGDLGIHPEDLSQSFFYHVYFNMGVLGKIFSGLGFPAESVEMLMGTLPPEAARPKFKPSSKTFSRLPWLVSFAFDKWTFAPKMKRALKRLEVLVKKVDFDSLEILSKQELVTAIDQHFCLMKKVAYYNVIGPLLMGMYNNSLARMLAQHGVDFNNFDLTEGMDELRDYDPSKDLEKLYMLFIQLPLKIKEKIKSGSLEEIHTLQSGEEFLREFNQTLLRFGHLSDSGNDFTNIPWREAPQMVLKMATTFEPAQKPESQKINFSDLEISGIHGVFVRLFYKRAREFRLMREEISHLYTYGYGLFRYYYLAIGKIFVNEELLEDEEDIFYLTDVEIRSIINGNSLAELPKNLVKQHKLAMERYQNISLPSIIFGEELPPVEYMSSNILVGVPTSGGVYRGRVRVVSGLKDRDKVQDGDVLVVPFSDVSWTPLFRRASAVIAESGGLLSH